MLASLLLLKERIQAQQEFPLMSVRDARILLIFKYFATQDQYEQRVEQMKKRHYKRQADIDRHYRYEELWI